jgi:hypothetical protein
VTADNVAWVDTETTGLHPWLHEIWEVGLVFAAGPGYRWFLPVDLAYADSFGLDIGRYHDRHPDGYRYVAPESVSDGTVDYGLVTIVNFAALFARLTFGLHIAGACIGFDDRRLADLLRSNGEEPRWHYHAIDVEALAAGWIMRSADDQLSDTGRDLVRSFGRPPWDSEELSREVGVEPDKFDRHTALGDCRWAKAMYEAVMGS